MLASVKLNIFQALFNVFIKFKYNRPKIDKLV